MTAGRWTFTCSVQHPDAKEGERPGCGHHEHHHSPKGADVAARLHQAEHAVQAGCPQREIPKTPDDPAWGLICRVWKVPPVAMDAGRWNPGCPKCDELAGRKTLPPPRDVPKAGVDFY